MIDQNKINFPAEFSQLMNLLLLPDLNGQEQEVNGRLGEGDMVEVYICGCQKLTQNKHKIIFFYNHSHLPSTNPKIVICVSSPTQHKKGQRLPSKSYQWASNTISLQYLLYRMQELISKMQEFPNLHSTIRSWCVQNSIEQPKIMSYPLEKVSKLYDNYLEKYGVEKNPINQEENPIEPVWFENQLILFQWTVVSYSLCHKIFVRDFSKPQIELLSSIFRQKEFYIIDYEIKCMTIKGKQIRNSWKAEQEKMLSSIINQMPEKNKWNQIARQLYKVSLGLYFRQGKHCRERWLSYMQIHKTKNDWTVEADIQLLQLVNSIGKNWNSIANNFNNSHNKSFLKKRFKIMTEELKAKFEQPLSDKQLVDLLLHEKYLQLSSEKKPLQLKTKKTQLHRSRSQSMALSIDYNIEENDSMKNQSKSIPECHHQEIVGQEEHKMQEKSQKKEDKCEKIVNGGDQQNWVVFPGSTQIFAGAYSDQYVSMPFYPQNSMVFDPAMVPSLSWWPVTPSFQSSEGYFFY